MTATRLGRAHLMTMVERYFEACNTADRELFREVLSEDCRHYFPPQAGGPYLGREAIADLWQGFVRSHDSRWTIDRMVCDGEQVVIEWTHFKQAAGEYIRGSEWYRFDDDGKICDIWAHYASPRDPARSTNVLEGFPYQGMGYPLAPPPLEQDAAERRAAFLASGPAKDEGVA